MGKIKCLNCGSELTMISGAACPACGVQLSHVKISFLSYLGPADSLAGYQRSYKLVLLKSIFEEYLQSKTLLIKPIVERFKAYYLQRKEANLLIDKEVDNRIALIDQSTFHDVYLLIKMNPYAAISNHGFLKINEEAKTFVLQRGIDDLTDAEVCNLLNLLDSKLDCYYQKIGSTALRFVYTPPEEATPSTESEEPISEITPVQQAEVQPQPTDIPKQELSHLAIEKLSLSNRAYNALKRNGVHTAADLETAFDSQALHHFRNIGAGTINEIASVIEQLKTGNIPNSEPPSNSDTENHLVSSDTSIENCFVGSKNGKFRAYCREKAIHDLRDLAGFDFEMLSAIKGFGPEKIAWTKQQFEWLCKDRKVNLSGLDEKTIKNKSTPFNSIHRTNFPLSIYILRFWDTPLRTIRMLYDAGFDTLEKLSEAAESELFRLLGKQRYSEAFQAIQSFSKPLTTLAEEILEECSSNKEFDFYIRRSEGNSLQEIAQDHNITRERVRQICLKFERKILPVMQAIAETVASKNGGKYCTEEQILEVFDNDDYDKVIVFALKNSSEYEYLDFAEIFCKASEFSDAEETLRILAESIVGEGINFFDELGRIEEALAGAGFGFITADAFIELLIKYNYKFYGDYVVKSKKSYGLLCAEIVADEFPNGIHITNEDDIAHLRASLEAKYGKLEVPENNRSFANRIVAFLVQSGRSTYIAPRNIMVDDSVLQDIKAYIDNLPHQDIYYTQIYAEYEGLLMMTSNIDNAGFLHGVLAWKFPDAYVYSRDFLRKHSAEETASLSELIRNYLSEAGHAVSKKEISDHFPGITDPMFNNVFYSSPWFLQWETGIFTCIDNLNISTADIAEFQKALEATLTTNGGYCSQELLYRCAQQSVPDMCARNHVSSAQNAFCIASYLFSEVFEFSRPHIALPGRFRELDVKTIALDLLNHPDILNANDFYALARKFEWSDVTAGLVFSNIEKEYIRLSKNSYQKAENFELSEADQAYISELLSQTAEDEWYLSLQRFADSDECTPSGICINDFVMNSIISKYGFGWHVVSPQAKDRRYEKGILVRDDKAVTAYDQLVAQVIGDTGIRTLSASQMLSFLQIHQLTFKTIPKELEVSDYFSVSNDQFSLT